MKANTEVRKYMAALAAVRWSKVSKKARREIAMKMVEARKRGVDK